MGQLGSPRRPVVWDVVTPEVELVRDALLGEYTGESLGAFQRSGGVLPLTLAAPERRDAVRQLGRAAAVVVDPGHHLVEDPRLVGSVPARPFLDGDVLVGPR